MGSAILIQSSTERGRNCPIRLYSPITASLTSPPRLHAKPTSCSMRSRLRVITSSRSARLITTCGMVWISATSYGFTIGLVLLGKKKLRCRERTTDEFVFVGHVEFFLQSRRVERLRVDRALHAGNRRQIDRRILRQTRGRLIVVGVGPAAGLIDDAREPFDEVCMLRRPSGGTDPD